MPLPGSNATVIIEHLTQTRDPHGGKTDGDPIPEETTAPLEAVISRTSRGNLWRIVVDGDHSHISKAPGEYRITDSRGEKYAPTKVTFRPPIERIGESAHTLIFASQHGEIDQGEVV